LKRISVGFGMSSAIAAPGTESARIANAANGNFGIKGIPPDRHIAYFSRLFSDRRAD
jgi:hypothetical protein